MTNNPTIDGVSRELRELLERVVGKPTGKPNWDALDEGRIAAAEELRALLDTPAVERQKPKSAGDVFRALTKEDYGRIGLKATVSQQATLIAALQSTIAQLQARIGELESGRGEPVAWIAEAVGPDGTAYRRTSSTTQITMRDAKYAWGERIVSKYEIKIQPLFTAPPAPVAVVKFANDLIDWSFQGGSFDGGEIQDMAVKHGLMRIEQRTDECGEACACREYGFPTECYRKNACLDATAALNGQAK